MSEHKFTAHDYVVNRQTGQILPYHPMYLANPNVRPIRREDALEILKKRAERRKKLLEQRRKLAQPDGSRMFEKLLEEERKTVEELRGLHPGMFEDVEPPSQPLNNVASRPDIEWNDDVIDMTGITGEATDAADAEGADK